MILSALLKKNKQTNKDCRVHIKKEKEEKENEKEEEEDEEDEEKKINNALLTFPSNQERIILIIIMVVGGSQQETLDLGFVLLGTRQQVVPVILRELVLPGGLHLSPTGGQSRPG
ncbi:unnamed protein product [Schistosoma curassoni]|uniref:Uncharacterized protein n=1 Tax=Schistosoma curassoni TaxID=6186 RepID=A0A183KCV7_9TREM|nr:unnamed protein product [Schistosoma curassoni]